MEPGSLWSLKGRRNGLACSGRSGVGWWQKGRGPLVVGVGVPLWNIPQEQAWLWEGLRVGWTARDPGQAWASLASTRWAAYVHGSLAFLQFSSPGALVAISWEGGPYEHAIGRSDVLPA